MAGGAIDTATRHHIWDPSKGYSTVTVAILRGCCGLGGCRQSMVVVGKISASPQRELDVFFALSEKRRRISVYRRSSYHTTTQIFPNSTSTFETLGFYAIQGLTISYYPSVL